MKEFARGTGVHYIDFNLIRQLDSLEHFYDWHHLTQAGVSVFLPALCRELKVVGVLPAPASRDITCGGAE